MREWEKFERECCDYLSKTYGSDRVSFIWEGGSDSTAPDIKVYIEGENKFNIEVKSTSAQSGQFVVLNQNGKFVFSSRNKSTAENAEIFLHYMNDNYDRFSIATTAGINLNLGANDINKWITEYYLSKNSQFIITRDCSSFIILPIDKYGEYFETICKYRIKRSGSSNVSKAYANKIVSLFGGQSYTYIDEKKLCVKSNRYIVKDRLSLDNYDYYVSEKFDDYLYIRKLSNTRNANVIFSIRLKQQQEFSDLELFKEALR